MKRLYFLTWFCMLLILALLVTTVYLFRDKFTVRFSVEPKVIKERVALVHVDRLLVVNDTVVVSAPNKNPLWVLALHNRFLE